MKKIREKSRKPAFFIYAVFSWICFLVIPASAADKEVKTDVAGDQERAIRALIDPFVPKVQIEPEPKPEPRPEPPKPVIKAPVPKPEPKPVVKPVLAPAMNITGVIFNPEHPMAIVNGEIVEQGQTVAVANGKAVVTKINKNSIEILYMGESFIILTDQEKK